MDIERRSSEAGRVCFLMHLKQDRVKDYLRAHQAVWPEMLQSLAQTGWRNYSLFIRESDGLVVGYLETDNFGEAQALMGAKEVNAKWQASMVKFFDNESRRPDESLEQLTEYFHLA